MFMHWISILPHKVQIDSRFNKIQINSSRNFLDINKLVPKFILEKTKLRILKPTLKKWTLETYTAYYVSDALPIPWEEHAKTSPLVQGREMRDR